MRVRLTLAVVAGLVTPVATQSAPGAVAHAQATSAAVVTTAPAARAEAADGYTYNAQGRRDPFVSLLRHAADAQHGAAGARPGGLSGLTAGEVVLKGTIQGHDGFIAMLLGADTRTYIVHPGDRLQDGTIRTITSDAVVIVQQVNDPLSAQKQREIRKTLRQTEEAK